MGLETEGAMFSAHKVKMQVRCKDLYVYSVQQNEHLKVCSIAEIAKDLISVRRVTYLDHKEFSVTVLISNVLVN